METIRCSFCGKNQDQVRKLIAGPTRVFICDQCVTLCKEIIDEEVTGAPPAEPPPSRKSRFIARLRRMTVALPR